MLQSPELRLTLLPEAAESLRILQASGEVAVEALRGRFPSSVAHIEMQYAGSSQAGEQALKAVQAAMRTDKVP